MPWWGKSEKPKEEKPNDAAAPSNDSANLPPRQKLPANLQNIVDKAHGENSSFFDDLKDGNGPNSTDSNIRYAAYATRLRTIMLSAHRYVAYTSDIGESFRPVAHPKLVRAAYGVSWMYLLGDVGYEGYRAYIHNQRILNPQMELTSHQQKITGLPAAGNKQQTPGSVPAIEDWRTVMLQRGVFQGIASMGLPAFTIHSVVRYSGRAMKDLKNPMLRTWAPIGLGLAVVPFLPAMFDEPVENAVEYVFHKGFEAVGGKQAVGRAPVTGREAQLSQPSKVKKD